MTLSLCYVMSSTPGLTGENSFSYWFGLLIISATVFLLPNNFKQGKYLSLNRGNLFLLLIWSSHVNHLTHGRHNIAYWDRRSYLYHSLHCYIGWLWDTRKNILYLKCLCYFFSSISFLWTLSYLPLLYWFIYALP